MRRLKLRTTAALALALQVSAVPAQALPAASLHWGVCPYAVSDDPNRGPSASLSETISLTATGLSGTVRTLEVTLHIWSGGSQVSDAWRFDSQGCEGGGISTNQGLRSNPCPLLQGTNAFTFFQVDYNAYNAGWSWGHEWIRYGAIFDPFVADPGKTYTLARFDFDHSSVSKGASTTPGVCGCIERPLCISIARLGYQDGDNQDQGFWIQNDALHWNDPSNVLLCPIGPDLCTPDCVWESDTTCVATTTAVSRSWGRVKASYR